jgi:hypothetical protein
MDAGALSKLFTTYKIKVDDGDKGFYPPSYKLIILGACAISLGCTLPDAFKTWLEHAHDKVNLMPKGVRQLSKALYGPDGAVPGKPFDLGSAGLIATMEGARDDEDELLFPNSNGAFQMLNTSSPFSLLTPESAQSISKDLQAQRQESKFAEDLCNGCGAKQAANGVPLLTCGKCKKRRSCSKACQKKMWKVHKVLCKKTGEDGSDGADVKGEGKVVEGMST